MKMNIGHNSINKDTAELLKKYIEGVENYENDKTQINESIKEIFDEAKARGFDVKTIKKIIKLRKEPQEKLDEEQMLLDTYLESLESLPLFGGKNG